MYNKTMPFLRGHHLVCLQFYRGEGYDRPFIDNLTDIIDRAETEGVFVVEGPDDVCRCCPYLKGTVCKYTEDSEEEIKEMDRRAMEFLAVKAGEKLHWSHVRERLPEIFGKWAELYCEGCHWRKACLKSPLYMKLKKGYTEHR